MFNERIALKIRLEQMVDAEERILQEFRKERETILERLRELDSIQSENGSQDLQSHYTPDIVPLSSLNDSENVPRPATKRIPKTKKIGKSRQMHEAAFKILRERLQPVKGTEIQEFIFNETGFKVANMTTFMKTIQRKEKQVRKLDRGLYIFEKES
ncbi:competence protein ComK [Jeotgalibacillus sp. S-D1]|uniref:Rok-like winged helix domain-containing protein n=1 Tax=Jeotgalibacillus sp. S-D1 TaxID=2552189 RepID=UPI0010599C9E|nr:competence protein ComK [Jeotgalibacillus sp. S-D1]TDL34864.1 competence protein ComK [Jeotgalibacillus sp. S-D1]